MITARYHVPFLDEAPRIGSGWRVVSAMIGRKWVRLAAEGGGRARLDKKTWALIARAGRELPPRRKRRKRRAMQ